MKKYIESHYTGYDGVDYPAIICFENGHCTMYEYLKAGIWYDPQERGDIVLELENECPIYTDLQTLRRQLESMQTEDKP